MQVSALEDWYERYGYAVYQRCATLLRSESDAQDAMHEVFLRAFRNGDRLRTESAAGWLLRIADRHCFDVLRARRRSSAAFAAGEAEEPAAVSDAEGWYLFGQVLSRCKPRVQEA